MSLQKNIDEAFLKLAESYKDQFYLLGDEFLHMIPEYESLLNCFQCIYGALQLENRVFSFGELDAELSASLMRDAASLTSNQAHSHLVKVAKSIHALVTICEN